MQRFDEVELDTVAIGGADSAFSATDGGFAGTELLTTDLLTTSAPPIVSAASDLRDVDAPRLKRLLALLTDLSLFIALTLAMSPLLPGSMSWIAVGSLGGFVVMISYYYFVCCWLFWGKTVGGAIFDVRVVPEGAESMSIRDASLRWSAVYLSLATAGIGFLLAALPSRRSLPDRLSHTRCITA